MIIHARWPFAVRVLAVSLGLAGLLAAAIVMLVAGRTMSVPAAASKTHTTLHRITAPRGPALNAKNGAPFLPAGLPTKDIGPPPGRLTPAERLAQARVAAGERVAAAQLAATIANARVLHRELFPALREQRRAHHRGYNRRPRARSSAG